MNSFEQHPDGWVIVRGPGDEYIDTPTNFAADYGNEAPALPAPFTGRVYQPGQRHHLTTDSTQEPAPLEWPEGDAVIAALPDLLAAQAARMTPPPPTPAEAETSAVRAVNGAAEHARLRYITPGVGQALTYLEKERDAWAYALDGYPSAQLASYPWIDAERQALGVTGQAAADTIIATADQWRAVAVAIERERRAGAKAVHDAAAGAGTDAELVADIEAARDAAVAALEAL